MPSYRGLSPRIRWGSGYTNAADIASLDNVVAYSEPRQGSDFDMSPAGVEDAWIVGRDFFLEGDWRWIPRDDSLTPKKATGWNGTAGVQELLYWARQKNTLKYHPDGRNLVVSPKMSADANADGIVDDFASNASGSITYAFSLDGAQSAQKIAVSAAVAGSYRFTQAQQKVYGIMPGESLTFSAEAMTSALTADGRGILVITYRDAADTTTIGQLTSAGITNTGSFARTSFTGTVPAGTGMVIVCCRFETSNGGTGNAWFRNAVLARNAGDAAAFIDNPSVDCTLTDPMSGAPSLEPNKMRAFHLKLRAASTFDGY